MRRGRVGTLAVSWVLIGNVEPSPIMKAMGDLIKNAARNEAYREGTRDRMAPIGHNVMRNGAEKIDHPRHRAEAEQPQD